MSYDLNFWKYKKGVNLNNQEVYEKCSDEEIIEGLEELPVDLILTKINDEFIKWRTEDSHLDFENPEGKGSFQVFTTNQFVRFDCYGMYGDDMNRIIDVMISFDCPLFDPQTNTRYDELF